MSNLFITTDMEQIQAMALIGHCLRNNLDMNTAWILMGASASHLRPSQLNSPPS